MTERTIHEGRNVKRIREIMGIKQDALAMDLGLSQQAVSAIEQNEALDKDMLEKIAAVLKVPAEAIRNYNEEATINIIANNCQDQSATVNYYPNFNPLDKYIEAMEANKQLYERLLQTEREKIELLERMLSKNKI